MLKYEVIFVEQQYFSFTITSTQTIGIATE